MNKKLQDIFEPIFPFIVLGIAIALLIGVFIMLSYVVLWGIVLGVIVWLAVSIKHYFFPPKKTLVKHKGQIIEHEKDD